MVGRIEATAIGRLLGMAILGGMPGDAALATAQPLTRMAVKAVQRKARNKRRELVQIADALAAIEDQGLHHLYTDAQLHALHNARSWDEIPALIAEWERWEAQASACDLDIWDGSNDYCAA